MVGAGLTLETLEDAPVRWRAVSFDEWWETVTDMSPGLSALLADLEAGEAAALRAAAAERIRPHVKPDGSLTVPGSARVALLRRPA